MKEETGSNKYSASTIHKKTGVPEEKPNGVVVSLWSARLQLMQHPLEMRPVSAGGVKGCIGGHVAFPRGIATGAGVKSECYGYCVGLTKCLVASDSLAGSKQTRRLIIVQWHSLLVRSNVAVYRAIVLRSQCYTITGESRHLRKLPPMEYPLFSPINFSIFFT